MITTPGNGELYFWRLDQANHAATWNSGIGAEKVGGRWNPKGVKVVYASADPSTAILEVAVHKGFDEMDTVKHVLTGARITDPSAVHVVDPATLPNPNWLVPGTPSHGQQQYGAQLLSQHAFVMIPSAVSKHGWNVLINPDLAEGKYEVLVHEPFGMDTRLNKPQASAFTLVYPMVTITRHG